MSAGALVRNRVRLGISLFEALLQLAPATTLLAAMQELEFSLAANPEIEGARIDTGAAILQELRRRVDDGEAVGL